MVINSTVPYPQPLSTRLVGEYQWDQKTQGGNKAKRGVCQTSHSYAVYSKNLQTTSSLHFAKPSAMQWPGCKKANGTWKTKSNKRASQQKPHHVFCLSDTHALVQRKGWHTNRSRVVRDSDSELWGSKEKGKKTNKKKCVKLTEQLPQRHSKQKAN